MSYISNPQNNASLLAEILTNMDPSQHDAVVLLNQLTESVSGLAYAQVSSMLRGHGDWRNTEFLADAVAGNASLSISNGVAVNQVLDLAIGSVASEVQQAIKNREMK